MTQYTYNVYSRNIDKSLSCIVASKCYDHEDAINFVIDELTQMETYHPNLAVLTVINGGTT